MPLEINHQTVPHLKALTHIIEHTSRHELRCTFKQHCTVLKSAVLLHKRAKRRFNVTLAVHHFIKKKYPIIIRSLNVRLSIPFFSFFIDLSCASEIALKIMEIIFILMFTR